MKTLHVDTLLDELQNMVHTNLAFAKDLEENHKDRMFESPAPGSWSAIQCLEHLNRYASFYHPEIESRLNNHRIDNHYKPSWLGNYFALSMLPTEKMKTMTTFKSKDPAHNQLGISVLETFIANQERMLVMIEKARTSDLGKVKCKTTLGSWLKFKIGDTLRFVVYHEVRHVVQAQKAVAR